MVVVVLLTAGSLFAVAALISHDQVLADGATVSSPSASASPTPTTTDTATPTPTPTLTIDPAAVILDIANYKDKALKVERKTKKVRVELVKRAHALGKQSPKDYYPDQVLAPGKHALGTTKSAYTSFAS